MEGSPVFSYGHVDTWWLTLSEGLRLSQRAGRMEDAVPNMVSTRKSRCWTSCSHDIPTFWAIRIHFRPQPLGYLYQLSQSKPMPSQVYPAALDGTGLQILRPPEASNGLGPQPNERIQLDWALTWHLTLDAWHILTLIGKEGDDSDSFIAAKVLATWPKPIPHAIPKSPSSARLTVENAGSH